VDNQPTGGSNGNPPQAASPFGRTTSPIKVPAFPGAEGFGASATGGRGGAVCRVKSLAKDGAGSLQACFDANGPRTIVFDVSGVIQGPLEIKHGQLTIAGQTSPGGITIKGGAVCDNVYDPNDCNDVIIRHIRFRGGAPDSLRLGGAHDVIVDHCSFASAEDENIEITRSRNITVQWSVIAEPRGDHYRWGGVLINYSTTTMPLDALSIHHTVWNGVAGRLPEISCEENGDGTSAAGGATASKSNCSGRTISVELSNNVMWDASDPIWFNRCTGTNQGNDCATTAPATVALRMNMIGNVLARRGSADADLPFADPAYFAGRNAIFFADNSMMRGSTRASAAAVVAKSVPARHPFPAITYTPSASLIATLAASAGAFPRDRMDARLASYLAQPIDARPAAWKNEKGVEMGDAFAPFAISALAVDSDGDGISDAWEASRGLDPKNASDGSSFGRAKGCAAGYTALECFINELAVSVASKSR
jgi:pectate lyase